MLISEAFPSEYLKAADLKGQSIHVVISHVEMRDVGDDNKPVVFFQNKTKGVVLNKTNSNNIALAYGDDTEEWTGKEVILYEAHVDFQGRTVPAIRIRPPQLKDRKVPNPLSKTVSPTETARPSSMSPERPISDEEVPF